MRYKLAIKWMVFTCLLGCFASSCQKDQILNSESTAYTDDAAQENLKYNEFGAKLEVVFSYAVNDPTFSVALVQLTQERRDGDFEILLGELMVERQGDGQSIKDFLLRQSTGVFSEAQLDAFLQRYPQTLIAVRGNPASWLTTDYSPPVKFVPLGFAESTRVTTGMSRGEAVEISLEKAFEDAIVAPIREAG